MTHHRTWTQRLIITGLLLVAFGCLSAAGYLYLVSLSSVSSRTTARPLPIHSELELRSTMNRVRELTVTIRTGPAGDEIALNREISRCLSEESTYNDHATRLGRDRVAASGLPVFLPSGTDTDCGQQTDLTANP